MFYLRPEFLERYFARVGHEKDEVRVSDIDGHRVIEGVPRQRQRGGVHRVCQRDFVPAEARLTEVDLHFAVEFVAFEYPPALSMLWAPVSWTTQRVAFPQLSTSPPSLFQMRIRRSALSLGSSTISWSQPTPIRRSAMLRARVGVR